jgi:hypothetical protein
MNKTTTGVTLKYPVKADGTELRVLQMRRPKVRDQLHAEKQGTATATSAEREIRLFANLCEVAPETLEDLDLADYRQLQETFQGFLSTE